MKNIILTAAVVAASTCFIASAGQAARTAGATCAREPFIVFFDKGSATLTPMAAATLKATLTARQACGSGRVALTGIAGHGDGSASLAARRNSAVSGYLAGHGLKADAISVQVIQEPATRAQSTSLSDLQERRVEISLAPEG